MSGATRAETKRKVVALYAQGQDHLKVRLRAVGDYLSVPPEDTSDLLALCYTLQQRGMTRLLHSLFADCLWAYAIINDLPTVRPVHIKDATKTVLGMEIRPRLKWLDEHRELVAYALRCDLDDLQW